MKFSFKHTKLACYGSYATNAIASNFPPVLFIIFNQKLGLSIGALGLLISINFGVQMASDILGAKYVDKTGYRVCAVLANSIVALGVLLMGILPIVLHDKFLALILATIVYAVGSGLLEVLVSPIMEAIPSGKKSANMSILHSFYCWGQAVAILVTTFYLTLFSGNNWWILCFFWAIIPVVTAILFCKVPINQLPREKNKSSLHIFKNRIFWTFLLLMTASGATEITISQWASLFVETALGVSKTIGDVLGPCMFAVLMGCSRIFYAKFSNKLNLSNYIMLCGVICILGYLTMAFVPNNYVSLAAIGIIGFSVGVMWPGSLSLASQMFPLGGTAMFGYLAIFGDIGCTSGPAVATVFSKYLSISGSPLRAGIAVCVIFPLFVLILTFIAKKMRSYENE